MARHGRIAKIAKFEYQISLRYVFKKYAGIVINIPKKNTLIISLVGSLNLSDFTKNKTIKIEGRIVKRRSSINRFQLLFLFCEFYFVKVARCNN